jgi:hypothetical protein
VEITIDARQVTEAQQRAYEALTDNFAAFQRRSTEFTEGGLEFARLQENNARAAQEWWTKGLALLEAQQRSASFFQEWLSNGFEALRGQTEQNIRTAEVFAESARKQQEAFSGVTAGWTDAYRGLFFAPFSYAQGGLKAVQQASEQAAQVTQQAARQGLQLVEETTEQSEQVTQEAEREIDRAREANRKARAWEAVLRTLGTDDYDGLTVAHVTQKLDDFSVEQLEEIRAHEKQGKDRETLVEQIDRKINAAS